MMNAKDYKNTIEFASEKVHNAWIEGKTCSDCRYFGNLVPVDTLTQTYLEDKCSGSSDDKICEKFIPKGLTEVTP